MINVDWKGKIGWGDILSPISYTHHLSGALCGEQVNLTFYWPHGREWLYNPADPEPLWKQADFFFDQALKHGTNVVLEHIFHAPLGIDHTNYKYLDGFHNWWFPKEPMPVRDPNYVLIGSPATNAKTLAQYGKPWKDPVNQRWPELVEWLIADRPEYTFEVIDYRTPAVGLYEKLMRAGSFIGYHGATAWAARFTHTPSTVFSGDIAVSHRAFPNALVLSDIPHNFSYLYNAYKECAFNKNLAAVIELGAYKFPHTFLNSLSRAH